MAGAVLSLALVPLCADTVLAPDLASKKIDYVTNSGKKIYADLSKGKAVFSKGGLELRNQSLMYEAAGVINLNNGTLSFDIEPLNFDANKWKPSQSRYITLFSVSGDNGFTQLWLYLYPQPNGGSLNFYSWDNNRATVQARGHLDKVPGALTLKRKTRIACTWDPQFIRLYVNGVEIANASYGLGSDRTASHDLLIRFMPENYQNPKKTKYHSRISNLYITDNTKSAAEIKAEYAASQVKNSDLLSFNQLVAPKLKIKPVIDGKASPGEWDDAATVPLQKQNARCMIDSDIKASVRIKHDFNNIYCLFDVPGTRSPQITCQPDKFSKEAYNGSLAEVYLRKRNSSRNDYYQFTVAPNNGYVTMTPNAKIMEVPFEHKTFISDDKYQIEMAIPLKSAGLEGLKDIAINFGLHLPEYEHLSLLDRWIAWSGVKRTAFALQCGDLTLSDHNIASKLANIGGVNYGTLELAHTVNAPSQAELILRDGTGKIMLNKKFTDAGNISFTTPLKWIGGGFIDFKVTDASGKVLNRNSGKLLIKEPFSFTLRTLPSQKKIEFDIDVSGLGKAVLKNLTFTGELCDSSGKKVYSRNQCKLTALRSTATITLPELKPDKYLLKFTLHDGKRSFSKNMPFERPDDTFIKKALGRERVIPAPWNKITLQDNKLSGSFFDYTFQTNSPFPVKADKAGKNILQTGNLDLVVNGKKQKFKHINIKIVENEPDRIITTGELVCSTAPLKIVYRRTASYDGLLKYDLKLVPEKPVTVNRFAWTGQIAPEMSKYGINPDVSPAFIKEYSITGKALYRTFPIAWVTGLKYGFSVFTDNDANWFGNDPRYAMIMDKNQQRTLLTAEMIAQDAEIKRPIPYVLAMMSTPGKPPRADWRQTYSGVPVKPDTGGTYYRTIGWGHERKMFRWYRWILLTHLWDPEAAAKRVAYFKKRGSLSIPYCCGALLPDSNPIFDYYGHEWRRSVHGRLQPACEQGTDLDNVMFYGGIPICANNPGFGDYMTYYTDQYLKKYDLYGLYLDFGGIYRTDKPFRDTDMTEYLTPGRKVTAWNVFGVRDLYERLRKVLQSNGKDKMLWIHEWDRYHPAITSFADLIYPGEEFMHKIRVNQRVYGEETPLEQWQSAYSSDIYGASVQFLTQYRYFREPIHNLKKSVAEKIDFARDLMTMILLHDITMSDTFTGPWHLLWDKLEMKKADFKSYYTNVPVITDNPLVKTALYTWKDRNTAVLILGNISNKPQSCKINDTALPLEKQAKDLFNNKTLDLSQNLKFRDFDFLVLEVTLKK